MSSQKSVSVKKKSLKCIVCRKKRLTSIICKCGKRVCLYHRLPSNHPCDFDWETHAKNNIIKREYCS